MRSYIVNQTLNILFSVVKIEDFRRITHQTIPNRPLLAPYVNISGCNNVKKWYANIYFSTPSPTISFSLIGHRFKRIYCIYPKSITVTGKITTLCYRLDFGNTGILTNYALKSPRTLCPISWNLLGLPGIPPPGKARPGQEPAHRLAIVGCSYALSSLLISSLSVRGEIFVRQSDDSHLRNLAAGNKLSGREGAGVREVL